MTARNPFPPAAAFISLFAVLSLACAGCQSTPKVDWNSRVGHYTYDQAVEELGPPDKTATLSDHSIVAEWITRKRSAVSFGIGTGYYGGGAGVGMGQTISPGSSDTFLRLVFGSDRKLVSWSRNY